jgi:peptidyl-prolyl cis-trans isomerase B (cyclophilin B)
VCSSDLTVENFKKLARQGFYDGTASHRILQGFMVQMGDPLTKDPSTADRWGTGGPGYTIQAEFNDRKHERGVLSMARGPDPNSAGSQFFICFAAAPGLDHQYTTFGKMIRGEEALAKLETTPCGPGGGGEMSRPVQRVAVESIRIVPGNQLK